MTGRLGFTFDLLDDHLQLGCSQEDAAEFDVEETIAGIESAATAAGWQVERIGHVRNLVAALASGRTWDLVFNFAEGSHGFGREAQVPALLDAYGIPYTGSGPLAMTLTLHKGLAKRVVRDMGLPTADFVVVEDEADVAAIDLPFPLFVKPVAEGSSKGIRPESKVTSKDALRDACVDLLDRFRQPVLVETFLPGREFTVGMLGTGRQAEALGVMEACYAGNELVYSFDRKRAFTDAVSYRLVGGDLAAQASSLALAVWNGLGCRDVGRVDLRCDAAGHLQFLEVNPIPGLRPHFSDLCVLCDLCQITHERLIARILDSARQRIRTRAPGPLTRLLPRE
jgi:D-alanine-D-alanine ligase